MSLKIDCISDTHNKHKQIKLPGGDILIHAGDATGRGHSGEIIPFLNWFAEQPYSHKVFTPGNHDFGFEKEPARYEQECKDRGIILLNDSGIEVDGVKIWGSGITPWFFDWAYNRQRGPEIKRHWDLIPEDTEILVTHGPVQGILDYVPRGENVGCKDLLDKVLQTKIKLHICGHIHYSKGHKYIDGRTFVNAASLSEQYQVVSSPITRVAKDDLGDYIVVE